MEKEHEIMNIFTVAHKQCKNITIQSTSSQRFFKFLGAHILCQMTVVTVTTAQRIA